MAPVFRQIRGRGRELIVSSAAFLVVTILVGAFFSAGAQAAPGALDPTFSGDGKQTTDFGSGVADAAAVALQPDGKIVAVGTTQGGRDINFALARYNPNGSLDTSFSGDGKQATDFGGTAGASGVAIQADGRIVAVGSDGNDFALARYNPNGSLDTGFSGDGKQTTDLGATEAAYGVAIQANGKIVAVGGAVPGPGAGGGFALARYNANGSLDTSFSGDGKQRTDFGGFNAAYGVALQDDGKIIAAGGVGTTDADFALARYNPNGSLDTSFSGDGKQTTDLGGLNRAYGVALQADGKIVAAGGAGIAGPDFALARYNPNGSLDTSFSGDGKQTTDFGGNDSASGVAIQANGRIVAVGSDGDDFALARYNPNGSLDTSFSGDGKQTTVFGGAARAVALQADGKIVAVGVSGANAALARYDVDGSLDSSFSGDGRQTTAFGGSEEAGGVAIQADGKIVAVGKTGANGGFGLVRCNVNGSLDTSFSGDGRQTTDFTTEFDDFFNEKATGVALQADGKIVVVGIAEMLSGDHGRAQVLALARYGPDGSLDPSFAGDGRQTGGIGSAYGVAIQADGRIVAVGGARGSGANDFGLARFNPNGSLDPSFSGDGRQTTDFGGNDFATGVAIQADGKIVAVGHGRGDLALARYNPNGSLDTSFSGDGKQGTNFGAADDFASGVAIQENGKIVALGTTGGGNFALARYNPNGTLDTSFSGDGKQVTNFGGNDEASGVVIQADGKIVAVGRAGGGATGDDFALARYNPNGSLDTSFSGDGTQRTNFGGSDDFAAGVALQADGRIVAVGAGLGTDLTSDFALARYLRG